MNVGRMPSREQNLNSVDFDMHIPNLDKKIYYGCGNEI
jgi:hypothetical protein